MPSRLNRLRERILLIRESATVQFQRGQQWIIPRWRWIVGAILIGGLLIGLVFQGGTVWAWYQGTKSPSEAISPLLTLATGAAVAWVALVRHFATTDADRERVDAERQRRITESFSKAIEQLGSDKLEVRLGGIYALERISEESARDYWTAMENLTAFVRERIARRERKKPTEERIKEAAYFLWEKAGKPEGRDDYFWYDAKFHQELPADIAAVLMVISRRTKDNRELERRNEWHLDLRRIVLQDTLVVSANLEGADLSDAHLEGADLRFANLERARLWEAHLEGAILWGQSSRRRPLARISCPCESR